MINKLRFLTLATLLSVVLLAEGNACDACGGSLGGFKFGIIPQGNTHFAGIKYSNANFYAEMQHGTSEKEYSFDRYQRWDVMLRASITDKWQINFVLPYLYNQMNGSHEKESLSGLGDPFILLNRKIVETESSFERSFQHTLWFGLGLKAPLASFDYDLSGQLINPNFQLGSGSWDYLASINYTVSKRKIGVNLEGIYKFNTANTQDYRFGNQFSAQSHLFYSESIGIMDVIPFTGLQFEYGGMHTFQGFYEMNTGGNAQFANAGLQLKWKNILINSLYQRPLLQHFNSDQHVTIEAKGRYSIALILLIDKKGSLSLPDL